MNTARHALYLPLTAAQKYEGKTAIEAFFWRFGDLLQAGAIYVGLNWMQFDIREFAMLNVVLSAAWLAVAWELARQYRAKELAASPRRPPQLLHHPHQRVLQPGQPFSFVLSSGTFAEADVGDVLSFTVHPDGADDLPPWLHFDAETLGFSGVAPAVPVPDTVLIVRATDFDGGWVEGRLVLTIGHGGEGGR